MKKKIFACIVVALLFASVCFVLFITPTYDLDTLTEKLNVCYTGIESITNDYNLENNILVKDVSVPLKRYNITLNNKSNIEIDFSVYATETQKGNGTFSVSYTISDVSDDNNFDIELFTLIVNAISGKTITTDFVNDFLTSPEEKYSSEKYDVSSDGYAINKMHALNFWEDWVIGYELTYDNHAELWLYGYIK